jgi:putative hemolysin
MTTKTIVIAIAALMSLVGCSEPAKKYTLVGFETDKEIGIAQDAAVAWCHAAGGAFCPTVTGGSSSISIVAKVADYNGQYAVGFNTHGNGILSDYSRIVIGERRDSPDWDYLLYQNILHELGHSAGCEDNDVKGTLMYRHEEGAIDYITAADVACVN